VLLRRAEEINIFGSEFIRGFFNVFRSESVGIGEEWKITNNYVTIVTISYLTWSKIESCRLGIAVSSPLEFFSCPSTSVQIIDKICEKLEYNRNFVKYVISAVEFHYNRYEYLCHIVKFVAQECEKQGISIPNFRGHYYKKISEICENLKNEVAFVPPLEEDDDSVISDIPLLSKFAIIATYCASYNPPSTDKRFFFGKSDVIKRKYRMNPTYKTERFHETGPRSFDQQRALFIFLFFYNQFREDNHREIQIDFNSQLTYLLSIGFLKMVSSYGHLNQLKYLSPCSLEIVEQIARRINSGLDLRKYLNDFAND